ncbi:MAG: phosphatase PAP2 family protein [Paludibacteraceae bacterium]
MDSLIHIDQEWLLAINGWHAEWADMLMWYISQSATWLPLYALLLGLVVYRFGIKTLSWKGSLRVLIVLAGFAVAVGLSDFVSSGLIKPWVCRLRPTHEPALAGMVHLVNGYTGGLYGFVSSHAANTMACALLFSLLYRNRYATVGLMLWVALNCYSRMYLGVHYPGDIIGGLLVGAVLATLTYAALRRLLARVDIRHAPNGRGACSEASCRPTADDEGSPTAGS